MSMHEQTRYRLTYDANPKELARRDAGVGKHVVLLWSRRADRATVVVHDDDTGEVVELDVGPAENALELYRHPYAYLTARGRQGRACGSAAAAA